MASYEINVIVARELKFHIEAESDEEIKTFLDDNPDWMPGDVPGLIDTVGEEEELGYAVEPAQGVTANFELVGGVLKEKAS